MICGCRQEACIVAVNKRGLFQLIFMVMVVFLRFLSGSSSQPQRLRACKTSDGRRAVLTSRKYVKEESGICR